MDTNAQEQQPEETRKECGHTEQEEQESFEKAVAEYDTRSEKEKNSFITNFVLDGTYDEARHLFNGISQKAFACMAWLLLENGTSEQIRIWDKKYSKKKTRLLPLFNFLNDHIVALFAAKNPIADQDFIDLGTALYCHVFEVEKSTLKTSIVDEKVRNRAKKEDALKEAIGHLGEIVKTLGGKIEVEHSH